MRDLIHFAHGNGFPARCYNQFLERLEVAYDCCYIDKVGHNPAFPVGENWHNLVLELLASIREQADRPVIAVGHSLGGVLSLIGAIEEPSLFKAVIMLDSPLIGPLKSKLVHMAKALGIIDRVTPAFRTKYRREHWRDYTELHSYLKSRDLFKTFDEACLEDYIQYGLEKNENGYFLRYDRHIEYQIYRTIPHTIPSYQGRLTVPSVLIYGDKTTVVDKMDRYYMKKKFQVSCFKIKGTHLFPMEYPKEAADKVMGLIQTIT